MRRLLLLFTAVLILLVLVSGAGAALAWAALGEDYADHEGPVVLDYTRGMTGESLAVLLEDRGVVRSRWLFQLVRALNPDAVLQAGEYEFTAPVSPREVFQKLAEGRVKLHPITIPEGLTRFETAARVAESGIATEEEFLELTADPSPIQDLFPQAESLEGCLFPETYMLPRNASGQDLLDAMLGRFRSAFQEGGNQTDLSPYEVLIMASLVEKETGVESERPLVSAVYHNRLDLGMRLQCDPTVIYGMLLADRYRGKIYKSDLETDHPYNTYQRSGLPPGPIASPGRTSIVAARRPADSKHLFFVARSVGEPDHVFSRSLAEHNRAVAAYRRTRP